MIEGRIEFAPPLPRLAAADVHVWIEDTTYADALAQPVFHQLLPRLAYAADPVGLPFRLDHEGRPPAGRSHTLSVLVDLDGDGRPGRGDYVSYQAVRLPEPGEIVRVRVQRIE